VISFLIPVSLIFVPETEHSKSELLTSSTVGISDAVAAPEITSEAVLEATEGQEEAGEAPKRAEEEEDPRSPPQPVDP